MLVSGVSLHRGALNGPDNRTRFYRATQAQHPYWIAKELTHSGNNRPQVTVNCFLFFSFLPKSKDSIQFIIHYVCLYWLGKDRQLKEWYLWDRKSKKNVPLMNDKPHQLWIKDFQVAGIIHTVWLHIWFEMKESKDLFYFFFKRYNATT